MGYLQLKTKGKSVKIKTTKIFNLW